MLGKLVGSFGYATSWGDRSILALTATDHIEIDQLINVTAP